VRPWAVDVSGGVENEDGTTKDLEKVTVFIDAKGIKRATKDEEVPEVTIHVRRYRDLDFSLG